MRSRWSRHRMPATTTEESMAGRMGPGLVRGIRPAVPAGYSTLPGVNPVVKHRSRTRVHSHYGLNSDAHPTERVHGSVYGIWYQRPDRPTLSLTYVGKYAGDWRERVRQHLYGGGAWHCEPKPWADLVPGYDPDARTLEQQRAAVDAVIAAGAVVLLWSGECTGAELKERESGFILRLRPECNIAENLDNPRHVPKWDQEAARAKRDASRASMPGSPAATRHRASPEPSQGSGRVLWPVWTVTALVGVAFISTPVTAAVGDAWQWVGEHNRGLTGAAVLLLSVAWMATYRGRRRGRRTKRPSRSRRSRRSRPRRS